MLEKRGGYAGAAGAGGGIVDALRELHPDLRIVDRDLSLGDERRADLVAVDGDARLVLVLLIEGDGDEPMLRTLDALAYLRRHRALLAEHIREAGLDPRAEPRLLLLADSFSERLLRRLGALDRETVRCYEMHVVASARSQRAYLSPVHPPGAEPRAAEEPPLRRFLRSLGPQVSPTAELLVRRISRIDDQLDFSAVETGLSWRLAGELLCTLAAAEGALEGLVPSCPPPRRIESQAQAEQFVDAVVQAYVGLWSANAGSPDAQPSAAPDGPVPTPLGGDSGASPAGPMEGPTPLAALDPRSPILTPEEIAAFQQPG